MAVEPGDAKFVSKLDEAGKKNAKDELHELNDKDRESAVQALRKWLLEQKWLKSITDFEFLLRFIRTRKYSQLGARETLENYWTNRTNVPEWFENVDPADEKICKMIRTGMMYCPKGYDRHGRRVIFGYMDNFDISLLKTKEGQDLMYKTCCLICDWLAYDENAQVNGVVFVSDYTGLSMEFMKVWNPEAEKKLLAYFQKSLPMRFKAFHMYKMPVFVDALFAIISPFMSQKFKDRMHSHGQSLVKIYEDLGMEVFPDEYLPDDYNGPSAGKREDIIEQNIRDMNQPEFRKYMLDMSSGKYKVDIAKRKAADKPPEASFRKLNVD
ncbi:retinaldehyde-binding protein 1-like isoform X2 [Mercenaria mercenaria]|uniref:retinaldehyde-binding protein 1-like isoform X1 n=1 Tax=Mercenaria mercenaria TaxID=6596 RepID=UPI00234EC5E2|nr:retinaldehyde-binding protein 1-like isoform X1 [Mercenaria mercenaria]XP_045166163.2 retinaldehyde-binding protein 1-like isoform X2 [Mercenaria mercenaria]